MIDAISILEQFADRHAPPEGTGKSGTVTYLDGLLTESVQALRTCMAAPWVSAEWREALDDVVREARRISGRLNTPRPADSGLGRRGNPSLPAITRAAVSGMERNGLFAAFRDRCLSLPDRLSDPDRAEAAVAELSAGIKVLSRYVG